MRQEPIPRRFAKYFDLEGKVLTEDALYLQKLRERARDERKHLSRASFGWRAFMQHAGYYPPEAAQMLRERYQQEVC